MSSSQEEKLISARGCGESAVLIYFVPAYDVIGFVLRPDESLSFTRKDVRPEASFILSTFITFFVAFDWF